MLHDSKGALLEFWSTSGAYRDFGARAGLEQSPHRRALADLLVGRRAILDLACGDGDNLPFLPEGADYVGCDYSPLALRRLLARADHPPLRKRACRSDAARLPVADAGRDAVVCSHGLEHFLDVPAVLGECARVLAPGGLLVIFGPDYTCANLFGPPQSATLRGRRLRHLAYTAGRLWRRLRHGTGPGRVVFEYVEPLPTDDASFLPDHDLTHLTSHVALARYLERLGLETVELTWDRPAARGRLRARLEDRGLWGRFADARLVMRKPAHPTIRSARATQRLVARQPRPDAD